MHVRDGERFRVSCIFSLRRMSDWEKEFGKCVASVRGSDNAARCHEKGYQARQPAYDIDQSVSLDEPRVSLNINYYCLFDTFQWSCRKHYVRVCHDNHDNLGSFVEASPGRRLSSFSRVTTGSVLDVLSVDSDIYVIGILRRICSECAVQLI